RSAGLGRTVLLRGGLSPYHPHCLRASGVVGFALYVLAGSGILFFDHQQNRMAPSQCHRARGSHRMTQPTTSDELELLKRHIRDVPAFPQPCVLFRDITPMLASTES